MTILPQLEWHGLTIDQRMRATQAFRLLARIACGRDRADNGIALGLPGLGLAPDRARRKIEPWLLRRTGRCGQDSIHIKREAGGGFGDPILGIAGRIATAARQLLALLEREDREGDPSLVFEAA